MLQRQLNVLSGFWSPSDKQSQITEEIVGSWSKI